MVDQKRLAALCHHDVLNSLPKGLLDRLTALTARTLGTPIAIVSIVRRDGVWCTAPYGIEMPNASQEPGLCASCVLQSNPWIVEDAGSDERAMANPLVTGQTGVRFYLGVPLQSRDGLNVGTLAVMDVVPRHASGQDIQRLQDLAAVVMDQFELSFSARRFERNYCHELVRRELGEGHIAGLMQELAHRSKNLLAVVQAVARHLALPGGVEEQFAAALSSRVQGLAHTHDLVAAHEWRGADLRGLAASQIGHFVKAELPQIEIEGPDVLLVPAAAQHLGLALHELAANAVKHGALSNGRGSASFKWRVEENSPSRPSVHLLWSEHGGPPVQQPTRTKFGCLVLERLTPQGLAGSASLSFNRDGVSWVCDAPSDRMLA